MRAMKPGQSQKTRKAFNLTEFAIVLGVGSAIIAAVWSLAGIAFEKARHQQLTDQIATVTQNVRSYYISQLGIPNDTLTSALAFNNIIPRNYVRNPGATVANIRVDGPWGPIAPTAGASSFNVCGWNYGTNTRCAGPVAGTLQYFAIELNGLNQSRCIEAVTKNTGANAPSDMIDVYINTRSIMNDGATTHRLPPVVADVIALCAPPALAANTAVDFVFRIKPSGS